MDSIKCKILVVDDDQAILNMLDDLLSDEYEVIVAISGQESIDLIKTNSDIHVVVMDIKMENMNGIEAAREIRKLNSDIPIIFHTGYPGDYGEEEIDSNEQPFDYITKGKSIVQLLRSVKNADDAYQLKQDTSNLFKYAKENYGLIGNSFRMKELYQRIRKVGPTDNKVMILGETGTGKELVAKAIHKHSKRSNKRLVIFNCNHKNPALVETELFGHKKGAFTHAMNERVGIFEYANGGTVFIDEIGDLDNTTQGKLLRVLESGTYSKIGEEHIENKTDVRIICATHQDLEKLVENGKFRQDLYFRLKGIIIELPPLRDKKEDIPLLIDYFVLQYSNNNDNIIKKYDKNAINVLIDYTWPGNVRQLLDTVESLIALTDSDIIFENDVIEYLKLQPTDTFKTPNSLSAQTKKLERDLIIKALQECDYNISAAARLLEIDNSTMHKKIKEYKISK